MVEICHRKDGLVSDGVRIQSKVSQPNFLFSYSKIVVVFLLFIKHVSGIFYDGIIVPSSVHVRVYLTS